MTKLEQAARQALEVLKNQSPDRDMVRAAFALQEALEQLNCQCGDKCFPVFSGDIEYCETCGKPTALTEQAEQEPVALNKKQDWANLSGEQAFHLIDRHAEGWEEIGAMMDAWLLAKQQTPREPVAEVFYETEYDESVSIKTNRKAILSYKSISELAVGTKLYAAPVRTKDLTDEDLCEIEQKCGYISHDNIRKIIALYEGKKNG